MIGARIKEERERFGMTQPQFAEAAGAAKRTLIEWEKGSTSPTAVQLSALMNIGVDVMYIITGARSANALAPEEQLLLERYRASDIALRDAALRVLLGGNQTTANAKVVVRGNVGQEIKGTFTNANFSVDMGKMK